MTNEHSTEVNLTSLEPAEDRTVAAAHTTERQYYVWFKSWYMARERAYLERPSFEVMREGERWARRQALKYLKEGRRPSVAEVMSVPWKGGT